MITKPGSAVRRDARSIKVAIAVLAKEPVPGRVKTRLCPPYSIMEAASLATAALRDTLDAVAATNVAHRLLVLDGDPSAWRRRDLHVLPQRGTGLAERIDSALIDAFGMTRCPVLLIGMDTPQVQPVQLEAAAAALMISDSALGPATDGGFWAIGLHDGQTGLCADVPMSRPDTGERQLHRMRGLGLHPALLGELTDVDDAASASTVARIARHTRFAQLLTALNDAA